jgi:hypothetical protein
MCTPAIALSRLVVLGLCRPLAGLRITGREAGESKADGTYPEGTVNRAVQDRLRELAEKGKSFFKPDKPGESREV